MVASQKFPNDFNGILAGSPAINWTEYVIAELWPQVVMYETGYYPTPNEFNAMTQLVTAACDGLDGVLDGVISDLRRCKFDPAQTVGQTTTIGNETVTITDRLASIVHQIWKGPVTANGAPLWAGLNKGAALTNVAATAQVNNVWVGQPFLVPQPWVQYFLKRDPSYDLSTLSSAGIRDLFAESVAKFSAVIDSADPDLSAFHKAGGKLLAWHGEADQLIFPQGTVAYRKEVEARLGHQGHDAGRPHSQVDDFFRLFLAPGVDHCNGGTTVGAGPSDAFGALREWVENGHAPDELAAASVRGGFERKLCKWPMVAKYDGHGDPNLATSFNCMADSW